VRHYACALGTAVDGKGGEARGEEGRGEVMVIRLKDDGVTKYYRHTAEGVPVLGVKRNAAQFTYEMARKVLEHLAIIDARFEKAEIAE
jgi:hypothetical protein